MRLLVEDFAAVADLQESACLRSSAFSSAYGLDVLMALFRGGTTVFVHVSGPERWVWTGDAEQNVAFFGVFAQSWTVTAALVYLLVERNRAAVD